MVTEKTKKQLRSINLVISQHLVTEEDVERASSVLKSGLHHIDAIAKLQKEGMKPSDAVIAVIQAKRRLSTQ